MTENEINIIINSDENTQALEPLIRSPINPKSTKNKSDKGDTIVFNN